MAHCSGNKVVMASEVYVQDELVLGLFIFSFLYIYVLGEEEAMDEV